MLRLKGLSGFCLVIVTIGGLLCVTLPQTAAAQSEPVTAAVEQDTTKTDAGGYESYLAGLTGIPAAKEEIRVAGADYIREDSADVQTKEQYADGKNVLLWSNGEGTVTYLTEGPVDALYTVWLTYLPLEGSGVDIRLGLRVNGEYPFEGMEKLELPRMWRNEDGEWRRDGMGNELTPEQEEYDAFVSWPARDASGVIARPYTLYLTAGMHELTLVAGGVPFALEKIELRAPEKPEAYIDKAAGYDPAPTGGQVKPVVIQGENAAIKSTRSLVPKSDNGTASLTPASPRLSKLNYIGGSSWKLPGETLVWNFTVETDGYYKVGFHFKQDQVINGESYRWLKIDGKTPFAEAQNLKFSYKPQWQFSAMSDTDGTPYLIWLKAGDHQLSLEGTLGDMAPLYRRLSELVSSLGDEYMKMVMITGESPDMNRDYELFRQVPDFEKTLQRNLDALTSLAQDMRAMTGKRSSQYIASLENMARVLRLMLDRPYTAHQYIKDYYTNYCTVSSWLYEMASMPLAIDEIQIVPHDTEFNGDKAGFFEKLSFGFQRFCNSFTRDYRSISAVQDTQKTIRLWVNWGRDQAMILNSLIQDSFVPETGIGVQLEIVNATLVKGILSGNSPDCALQMARAEPVNLGMRHALYDLTQFDDFNSVLERFQPGAEEPYRYSDACYALPDTQTFFSMFYRSDVFEELGLTVPETWEDFIHAATVIQRNNMQVYIPYTTISTTTSVDTGLGNLNLYATMMAQSGLPIYNDSRTATAINTPEAISVFEQWTRLYTDYKFLKEADFYNRFSVGTMPLGIAPYTLYLTLSQAASGIQGRWSVEPVPSFTSENKAITGAGTGCAIVAKSSHVDEAWEFLKWWTSAQTQARYSRNLESVLGLVGRHPTATVEAFADLAWEPEVRNNLMAQWENVEELPEIPGSYYLTQAIDQAFWAVVNGESNGKDAILKWSEVADAEISRKIKEYVQ